MRRLLAPLALALALVAQRATALPGRLRGGGPTRGCERWERAEGAEGAGGASTVRVRCALPSGRVTLVTDHKHFVIFECESNASGHVGRFHCEELEEARAALRAGAGAARRWVDVVHVERCELPGPLRCILDVAEVLSARGLRLSHVPTQLRPEHLHGLNITSLEIPTAAENATGVPYDSLAALPQLRELSMGGVRQLAEGWRPSLQHLDTLYLSDLVEVPAKAFEGLPKLRTLGLWGYTIKNLNEKAFSGLSELVTLYIKSDVMKAMPPDLLLPTPSLKMLHLFDNQLEYLPRQALRHLRHLEEVLISNGNVTVLHLEAGTFADLPALRNLEIMSSGVRVVPVDLVRGSRMLEKLSLKRNQLTELPRELLAEQTNLQILILEQNRLDTLPHNLFSAARRLKELNLSNNAIKFLPDNIFKNLWLLKVLDLSQNKIMQINLNTFEGLKSIEWLSLSGNALTSPQLRAWRYAVHLKTLDLSYNAISQLSDRDLNFESNAVVNLRYNNISRLYLGDDPQSFYAFGIKSAAATFHLTGNPFMCDCNLYNFVRALNSPEFARRFYVESAFCAAPATLAGQALGTVNPGEMTCDFAEPFCPTSCACALRPATMHLELLCDNVPHELPSLALVNVSTVQLRLRSVPADLAGLSPEISYLNLSGLELTVAPRAIKRVTHLSVDLSNNKLKSAPLSLLEANYTVRLAGNEFECDCQHRANIATLERYWSQIEDGVEIRCRGGGYVVGLPSSRLCNTRDAVVLGGSLAVFGLVLTVLGVLAFRYSTEIRLVLRWYEIFGFLFEGFPDTTGLEKEYDAFVSFSHHDDDLVRKELVPQLEAGRRPLKLCLHYRDWEIGGRISEQIARSVHESRQTIVVLSREFLESMWGKTEFRAAHALDRVILLLRGDVLCAAEKDPELLAYLTTNTYVHAEDPLVWDRVRDTVLRSRRPHRPLVPNISVLDKSHVYPAIISPPPVLNFAKLITNVDTALTVDSYKKL